MTFPRDDEPGAETPPGQSASESEADTFAPPERGPAATPASQSDLWASEPQPAAASQGDLWATDAASAASAGQLAIAGASPDDPFGDFEDEAEDPAAKTRRYRRIAWELTQTLVLAVLIFLLVRTVAQNFRVEGPSMEPGLHDGQYLLVNKAVYFDLNDVASLIPFVGSDEGKHRYLFHGPQRGDVIVFRYPRDPDRDFIKRIIGVPGDTVRVEDGFVYVNDSLIDEDYISEHAGRDLESLEAVECTNSEGRVPEGNYFVLGDNRPNSSDSRSWGCVPEDHIIGKALLTYWPLEELGGVGNRSLDLGVITLPLP